MLSRMFSGITRWHRERVRIDAVRRGIIQHPVIVVSDKTTQKARLASCSLTALSVLCLLIMRPVAAQTSGSYCSGYPDIPEATFCAETPIGACAAYYESYLEFEGLYPDRILILPFGGQGNLGDDELILTTACAGELDDGFYEYEPTREVFRLWTNSGTASISDIYKQNGCQYVIGNPCNPGTGNKFHSDIDYSSTATGLSFERSYNSFLSASSRLGFGWSSNLHKYLKVSPSGNSAFAMRNSGQGLPFSRGSSGSWQGESDTSIALNQDASGYWLQNQDGSRERYSESGRLQAEIDISGRTTTYIYASNDLLTSVIGPYGHEMSFAYDATDNLTSFTDPSGGVYAYTYDSHRNLTRITYPDGNAKIYHYENSSFPNHLTGISYLGSSGQPTRYAVYTYDAHGRAVTTEHAGGADRIDFIYNSDDTTTVNAAVSLDLSVVRSQTISFTTVVGIVKPTQIQGAACESCGGWASSYTYDINGNVSSKTDFNGNVTTYQYDLSRNLETSRTEAYGTAKARTITTQWHPIYRLPTLITEPGRTTSYTYDASGNQLTRTVTDTATNASRTWTYTYNSFGQVLTADGPRTDVSDVTTYTWYECNTGGTCGQLHTVTNALGQTTTYASYNNAGQPLTIVDANGVTTTLTYDARQHLTSRSLAGETTSFEYWSTGLLKKVTLPDASFVSYAYDDAHRLTSLIDSEGNSIVYTLDAAGNRTKEEAFDASNNLARTHSRIFNSLGRLTQELGAANQSTSYGYDNNGNLLSMTDPVNRTTQYQYDPLNRLTLMIDPALQNTSYGYDALDNLTSVTDPKALTTTYAYNGLGDLTQLTSSDTGITHYVHDAAGNLDLATDARNKAGDYSYDALGRVTQIQYSDQIHSFQYDQGANGQGHLTQVTDSSGSTSYTYDGLGRIQTKTQTVAGQSKTVHYVYSNGQLTNMTTPSGQSIGYSYYAHGKISAITVNGQPLLSNVLYSPFGPTRGWTWVNGTLTVREYNTDGQLTTVDSAGLSTYRYNPDGTIASVTHDSSANLDLSTGQTNLSVSTTSNRINSTAGTLVRTYSYDAAGNMTGDGQRAFIYNDAGRMTSTTHVGITTSYLYNALGQRVQKSNANGTTNFVYDESGHLLGEYDQADNLIQEIVWLDDIPVATIRTDQGGTGVGIFYIHTDHLNAPSKITRPNDNAVIWRWNHDPFGNGVPNQDPDGNGLVLTFNLRFPGQYFDAETGLNQNHFRDYDPATGRYAQSDPIGLAGGSFSTYAYANNNPISNIDLLGLAYFASRPLSGLPWLGPLSQNPVDDFFNTEISHEQLFFEDGKAPSNLGFFDDG
ncbi:MAG: RHS repeat-associated core domain-containing protein, partial [Steroidobacteraceae bacterium]